MTSHLLKRKQELLPQEREPARVTLPTARSTVDFLRFPRSLPTDTQELQAANPVTPTARFGHDLSRIPIYPVHGGTIQAKLTVNEPGDELEQEADRVADRVMRMSIEPRGVRRKCSCGGTCDACQGHSHSPGRPLDEADFGPVHVRTDDLAQRSSGALRSDAFTGERDISFGVNRSNPSSAGGRALLAHELAHTMETLRLPGQPLDTTTREDFEARFGYNFGDVRIHNDRAAARSARDLSALAYTVGSHIAFAEGRYSPSTAEGRKLLAHELTHLVQQQRGTAPPQVARQPTNSTPPVTCNFNCTDPAFTALDATGRDAQFQAQCPQGYPKGTTFFGQPIPAESSARLKSKLLEAEAKAKRMMCLNGQDPNAYSLDRKIITYRGHSPAEDRAIDIDVMGQTYIMHEGKRSSTVAGLPSAPAVGTLSYVTDGATATDCRSGGGTNRVICSFDGTGWVFARGVGDRDEAVGPIYHRIQFWSHYRKSIIPTSIKTVELGQGGGTARTWINPDSATKESISTGELYDKLKTESDAMKAYFSLLLKSDADLATDLQAFHFGNRTATDADLARLGLPTGHTDADAKAFRQAIADDYRVLGGSKAQLESFAGHQIATASHTPQSVIGNRPFAGGAVAGATLRSNVPDPAANRRPELGFVVLPKEVVVALTEVGLAWGAIDFGRESGDVMHFDCRNTSC